MHINIKIPDELNERRKALNMTWREIIEAGIKYNSLDKPNKNLVNLKPNLKVAIKALKEVWDSVQEPSTKTPKA